MPDTDTPTEEVKPPPPREATGGQGTEPTATLGSTPQVTAVEPPPSLDASTIAQATEDKTVVTPAIEPVQESITPPQAPPQGGVEINNSEAAPEAAPAVQKGHQDEQLIPTTTEPTVSILPFDTVASQTVSKPPETDLPREYAGLPRDNNIDKQVDSGVENLPQNAKITPTTVEPTVSIPPFDTVPSQTPSKPPETANTPPPTPLLQRGGGNENRETALASPSQNFIAALLTKANSVLQFRKQKKLEKILVLAGKKNTIGNDDVQKALRISHVTAARYLAELVRTGKLEIIGNIHQPRYKIPG